MPWRTIIGNAALKEGQVIWLLVLPQRGEIMPEEPERVTFPVGERVQITCQDPMNEFDFEGGHLTLLWEFPDGNTRLLLPESGGAAPLIDERTAWEYVYPKPFPLTKASGQSEHRLYAIFTPGPLEAALASELGTYAPANGGKWPDVPMHLLDRLADAVEAIGYEVYRKSFRIE